ncbi:MAG: hypothetical protein WBB19_17510 [Desulforhopalus sp.]
MSACRRRYTNNFYISFYAVLSLLFIFTTYSQASGENTKEEIQEAAAAIGDYTVEQKDAAVAKAKELMEKLDTKITVWEGQLEENWSDLKQSSRENYQQSLRELRKQRNDLSEWYGSMKYSSKEAWNEVKQGFSNAYDSLADAYSDTEENMNKEQ